MVRNYWYAIARSSDITARPTALRRFGQDLVLWRNASGQLVCLPDRCSHRGAPISNGKILKDGCLECPYHGLRFDSAGRCVLIPADGAGHAISPAFHLAPFSTREHDGLVWYWWGEGSPRADIPHFEEAPGPSVPAHTITLEWNVPFSRVMESMFDMHHFPFLHRKVSHGIGPLLDPYDVTMTGDRIEAWGNLRPDDGKSADVSPGFPFHVTVLFPATMFMGLTEKLKLLLVAAPIDEGRTWLTMRYYQMYVQLPVIGGVLARLSAGLERWLVHPDDERQLRILRPPLPGHVENQFIKADRGVATWLRRYRAELAAQSKATHPELETVA